MRKMQALTIWQPWASLIVHGFKRIENRTWAPPADLVGTTIAIHAGKKVTLALRGRWPKYSAPNRPRRCHVKARKAFGRCPN